MSQRSSTSCTESVIYEVVGVALLTALIVTALTMYQTLFTSGEWQRLTAFLTFAILAWGVVCRRTGTDALVHLLGSVVITLYTISFVVAPHTMWNRAFPTLTTFTVLNDAVRDGLELVIYEQAPVPLVDGFIVVLLTAVWVVTYLAEGMFFVLRESFATIVVVTMLWAVPLVIAGAGNDVSFDAVWVFTAISIVLIAFDRRRHVDEVLRCWSSDAEHSGSNVVAGTAFVPLLAATAAAVVVSPLAPGFNEAPIVTPSLISRTTVTTNPIVDIRTRLVARDTGTVLSVVTPRPVYLRTTSLNIFHNEQWGAPDIEGRTFSVPTSVPADNGDQFTVDVTVGDALDVGSVLVPSPYGVTAVGAGRTATFRYDPRSLTFFTGGDEPLLPGDHYQFSVSPVVPDVEELRAFGRPSGGPDTELLSPLPTEVTQLAASIVENAGAETMYDIALAVQEELRTWTYTTTPARGNDPSALVSFITLQEGYCEQYAGTMTAMLRSLGVPARLAVGFTPGTPDGHGGYTISNANAHAWVEVRFGDQWVPFEPTPRSDGNVLVPSAETSNPTQTATTPTESLPQPSFVPEQPVQVPLSEIPDVPVPTAVESPSQVETTTASPTVQAWFSVLFGMVIAGFSTAVFFFYVRPRQIARFLPSRRIERAYRLLCSTTSIIGKGPRPSETEREFLARITDSSIEGEPIAVYTTAVRFGPDDLTTDEHAAEVEQSARSIAATVVSEAQGVSAFIAKIQLALWRNPVISRPRLNR